MDDRLFDELTRLMAGGMSRREAVKVVLGGSVASALGALGATAAEAAKGGKGKGKAGKPAKDAKGKGKRGKGGAAQDAADETAPPDDPVAADTPETPVADGAGDAPAGAGGKGKGKGKGRKGGGGNAVGPDGPAPAPPADAPADAPAEAPEAAPAEAPAGDGGRALSPSGNRKRKRCAPNGRRCGTGGKLVSCSKCCSGRSAPGGDGLTYCACKPGGMACDGDWQCCTGICNKGTCDSFVS